MRTGFRPPTISQIFAPMPAAKSRCLSAFVAIARQSLPIMLRYEPSHLLAFGGIALLLAGFFTDSLTRFAGTMISTGWGFLILAFFATLTQDRLVYGLSKSRLIRQLDEVRRSVGLDEAILPESLEFLEATAQQWERIEHAMQTQVWRDQPDLRFRIDRAAHRAMESVVLLECGSTDEAGLTDQEADQALVDAAASLRLLADSVDAMGVAVTTYPREMFTSNGVEPTGVIAEVGQLEEALSRLEN